MTSFELAFSLFGLVLGLSLTEVLGGFGAALKLRRHARATGLAMTPMGWLTPLLAIFLLLDIAGFWFLAWRGREAIPATPASLLLGLAVTSLYFVAASWVFPHEPPEGANYDAHYFENKRSVLLLVLLCNVLAHGARLIALHFHVVNVNWGQLATYFVVLIAAAFVRGRTANAIALGLLISLYLLEGVGSAIRPPSDVVAPVASGPVEDIGARRGKAS